MEHQVQANPADRPLVTFDNNVLIALNKKEPDAQAVRDLLSLNAASIITINITLSTLFEARRSPGQPDMAAFAAELQGLGILPGSIFTSSRTIGFKVATAPDAVTFSPELDVDFTHRIHQILFPAIPFMWRDYRDLECERRGAPKTAMAELDRDLLGIYIPPTPQSPRRPPTPHLDRLNQTAREELRVLRDELHRRWSNVKNDALGLHNHITQAWHTTHPEHAVFVTSDRNFRKKTKLAALRALGMPGEILPPLQAISFLRSIAGIECQNPIKSDVSTPTYEGSETHV